MGIIQHSKNVNIFFNHIYIAYKPHIQRYAIFIKIIAIDFVKTIYFLIDESNRRKIVKPRNDLNY